MGGGEGEGEDADEGGKVETEGDVAGKSWTAWEISGEGESPQEKISAENEE